MGWERQKAHQRNWDRPWPRGRFGSADMMISWKKKPNKAFRSRTWKSKEMIWAEPWRSWFYWRGWYGRHPFWCGRRERRSLTLERGFDRPVSNGDLYKSKTNCLKSTSKCKCKCDCLVFEFRHWRGINSWCYVVAWVQKGGYFRDRATPPLGYLDFQPTVRPCVLSSQGEGVVFNLISIVPYIIMLVIPPAVLRWGIGVIWNRHAPPLLIER